MRVRGLAAVTGAAFVVIACGLDMGGLGDVASDGGAGGADADASGGADVFSAEGGDSTAANQDGTVESGSPGEAAAAETASGVDAPGEVSLADAPPPPSCPPGVMCNGTCTASTDCHACPGAPLLCGATNSCGADCTACASSPIECYACDSNRQNPIGACERQDPNAYCLNTNYFGAYVDGGLGYHCGCTTAADCLSDSQVCIQVGITGIPGCFTCGEVATDTFTCKTGKRCNAMKAACN